jgi:hypothetical protein
VSQLEQGEAGEDEADPDVERHPATGAPGRRRAA